MFVKRLLILFAFLAVGVTAIGMRLAQLQVAQVKHWRDEAKTFINRHYMIPTTRGAILDCKGRYLALDQPCYNLAIDYRAMNHDDGWITEQAIARLKAEGKTRLQRIRLLAATKRKINHEINAIPAAIAKHCHVTMSKVLERFDEIRWRIRALRQDLWSKRYSRENDIRQGVHLGELEKNVAVREQYLAHTIIPAISTREAYYFAEHANRYPGLVQVDSTRRWYPYGSVAAQTIGVLRPVSPAMLKKHPFMLPRTGATAADDTPKSLAGYLPGDLMGASGVERAMERQLHGARGMRLVTLEGREHRALRIAPVPGKNVQLTLDIRVQQDLQKAILDPSKKLLIGADGHRHPVAVAIVRVRNSDILTLLSLPTYNLNTYHQRIAELLKETHRQPLMNRALGAAYQPGSIVKPLVSAAALTTGVIQPGETVDCRGYLFPGHPTVFRCWIYTEAGIGHGPVDVQRALEQSCDVFFYTMGMRLGLQRIVAWDRAFGLDRRVHLGLIEDSRGLLISPHAKLTPLQARNDAIFLGIGQGPIAVTPLQMANAYAALLRDGLYKTPRLIVGAERPAPYQIPIASDVLPLVRRGMRLVVAGAKGTAPVMRMRIPVAGKTGTATVFRNVIKHGKQTVIKEDNAWFVGYVPANHPKYVIAAVMEFGGEGGAAAAPLVRQAILALERNGYLPPVDLTGAGRARFAARRIRNHVR